MTTITPGTQASFGARRLELSRVGELTFDILKREFAINYGLAVAINAAPVVLNLFVARGLVQSAQAGAAAHRLPGFFAPSMMGFGVVTMIAALLVYGALSWGAVERLQGQAPPAGERLSAALRALPVMIGVSFLGYIALVFATLLFVIPMLFLITVWAVVIPVIMVEKTGVFATFRRSGELTKGNRWMMLLLLVIFAIGSLIVSVFAAVIVRAVFGASSSVFAAQPLGPVLYVSTLINLLVSGLVGAIGGIGLGVVYHELRAVKGGFDQRRLSDVFA